MSIFSEQMVLADDFPEPTLDKLLTNGDQGLFKELIILQVTIQFKEPIVFPAG